MRIYRGDLWPDLEEALVEEVRSLRAGDPWRGLRVVVPTSIARSHVRALLAERLGGHLFVEVDTLGALARRLGGPSLAESGKSVAPPAALALSAAMVARARAFESFGRAPGFRGFGAAAASTLRDLSDAGLVPGDLTATATKLSSERLFDLRDLWTAVRKDLERAGWVEEAALYAAAARRAAEVVMPTIAYGLYDVTYAQSRLLERLLDGEAAAMVPAGPAFADPFVRWLEERGGTSAPTRPRRDVAIEVRSCPSPAREAREAVRAVVEAGVRLDRTAILGRIEALATTVVEVLEDAGIPADVRLSRVPSRDADGAFLLALLEARRDRSKRHAWMEVLTESGTRLETLAPDADRGALSPARWDRLAKELSLSGDVSTALRRLRARAEAVRADSAEDSERADREARPIEAFATALESLDVLLAEVPDRALPGASARALHRIAERLLGRGLAEPACGALDEIATLDALGHSIDLADAGRALRDALYGAGEPPEWQGGCLVADLLRARGATFHTLVLCGLNERVFPRVSHGDPLLGDPERAVLRAETGRPLAEKIASSEAEERFLFRLALGSVSGRVVATFHRRDERGTERAPSIFVHSLSEAGAVVQRIPAGTFHPISGAPSIDSRERRLEAVHAALGARDERALAAALSALPARTALRAEEERWRTRTTSPFDGRAGGRAPETGVLSQELSATKLERFVRCPFHSFVRDLLGATDERESESTLGLDPLQRGLLVHRVLERLVSRRAGRGEPVDLVAAAREELGAEIDRLANEGALTHAPTALAEASMLAIAVAGALERLEEDALRPSRTEVKFEGVALDVAGRTLKLAGRIDRVDLGAGVGRVVDYKTGARNGPGLAVRIQLPVYAAAARRLYPDVREWTGRLEWVVDGGKRDEVGPAELEGRLLSVAEAFVSSVMEGVFPQNPDFCRFCGTRAACEPTAAIERLARRKNDDPARARIAALTKDPT